MLKLGKGVSRAAVRRGLKTRRPTTFTYQGVLRAPEIRAAIAGIRDAGTPRWSLPLLAWLAGHPNTPEDVLRELLESEARGVLMSLAVNPRLPAELRRALLRHPDPEVRDYANQSAARVRRH
jgi:hypothetical protein